MLTEIEGNARTKRVGKIAAKAKPLNADKQGKDVKASPSVDSPYLTTTEAAAYIKMSRQFLEAARYRADGSGPPYIKVGRSVRYRRSKLDASDDGSRSCS